MDDKNLQIRIESGKSEYDILKRYQKYYVYNLSRENIPI